MTEIFAEILKADIPGDGWRRLSDDILEVINEPDPPPTGTYSSVVLGRKPVGTLFNGGDLAEASGGMDSRLHDDTWWTHSDSAGPRLYALGYNGTPTNNDSVVVKKGIVITGIEIRNNQFEDCAYDQYNGRRKMWVANCGGGQALAQKVNSFPAYHFNEPTNISNPGTELEVPCDTYWFKYPGTERWDCESMMCDPNTSQVFFLTKEPVGTAQVYAAPMNLVQRTQGGNEMNVLIPITSGNFTKVGNMTAADIGPSGTKMYCSNNNSKGFRYDIVRDGSGVITDFVFEHEFFIPRPVSTTGTTITAETLFVTRDSLYLIRNSEGPGSQIIRLER